MKMKSADDGDDEADRADDEHVAADRAARGEPEREQEQEGARRPAARPSPCRTGGSSSSPNSAVSHSPLEAAQPDAEALQQELGEAGRADGDRAGGRTADRTSRGATGAAARASRRPSGASHGFSPCSTRNSAGATSSSSGQPSNSQDEREEIAVEPVPGQQAEADPADRHPEDDGRMRVAATVVRGAHRLIAAATRPRRPTSAAGACARRSSRTS